MGIQHFLAQSPIFGLRIIPEEFRSTFHLPMFFLKTWADLGAHVLVKNIFSLVVELGCSAVNHL